MFFKKPETKGQSEKAQKGREIRKSRQNREGIQENRCFWMEYLCESEKL